jgi:hypothetical protein
MTTGPRKNYRTSDMITGTGRITVVRALLPLPKPDAVRNYMGSGVIFDPIFGRV